MLEVVVSRPGEILMSLISFSRSGTFYLRDAVELFLALAIEEFLLLWREKGDYLRLRE